MNLKNRVISGIKWTSVGTIGRSLFQLLQVAILTRYLSKEDFGLVAMALFVIQFSTIFIDMGISSAILHRQNTTKNEYSSIYWLSVVVSFIIFIIVIALTPFLSSFYNESELNKIIPLLAINLLLMAMGQQHRTIMQKQFQFKAISIIEIFSFFLSLIVAVILAVLNFGIYSLVFSTLTASLISNILFLTLNLKLNPIRFNFNFKDAKPFFKVGSYTMGSSLLDFFSKEIDILIIGKMLGAENLGLYSLAKQIIMKLYAVINPIIINVLNPVLSSIQTQKEKIKQYYLQVVNFLATLNFPIYLLIIVLSKEILSILYGKNYIEGSIVLGFLAITYATNTINNPVGSLQIATGRTDIGFIWTVVRVLLTPIVVFFSAQFNINAVAISLFFLNLILIIPFWRVQLKTMANIKLNEYLYQFWKPYLLFLFLAFASIGINPSFELQFGVILNIIIKSSVALISNFGLLWLIDKERILFLFKSLKNVD